MDDRREKDAPTLKGPPIASTPGQHAACVGLCSLATAFLVCGVLASSSDVRGGDQYFYVADTTTLLNGGPKVVNTVYPIQLMDENYDGNVPFLHHTLNIYLVLPFAWLAGPFWGWILANLIASVTAAILLAVLVRRLGGLIPAACAYSLYLVLPVTFWQTSQPLVEATTAPFVAAAMLVYVLSRDQAWRWLLLASIVAMAFLCRKSYLPILYLLPPAYLLACRPPKPRTWAVAFVLVVIALGTTWINKRMFPEGMPTSLAALLENAVPGKTDNMHFMFALDPGPFNLSDPLAKLIHGLHKQFSLSPAAVFFWPVNLLVAVALVGPCVKRLSSQSRLDHCVLMALGIHLLQMAIHQNQFRYGLLLAPPALASAVLVSFRFPPTRSWKLLAAFCLAAVLALGGVDAVLGCRVRHDAAAEGQMRATLADKFNAFVVGDQPVIVESEAISIDYVLRPRRVLRLRAGYSKPQYASMLAKVDAAWLFCPEDSALPDELGVRRNRVDVEFPSPYDHHRLYSLRTAPSPQKIVPRP